MTTTAAQKDITTTLEECSEMVAGAIARITDETSCPNRRAARKGIKQMTAILFGDAEVERREEWVEILEIHHQDLLRHRDWTESYRG